MENIVNAAEQAPEIFGHYLEDIDSGKTSINYVNKVIERLKDHKAESIAQLPEGEFDVIITDPHCPHCPHWSLFQFKFGLDFFTNFN